MNTKAPPHPKQEPDEKQTLAKLQEQVSASRLTLFLQYRLKFYFRYVLRLSKAKTSSLHLGSSVHAVLKRWNKGRWLETPLTLKQAHEAYVEAWTDEAEGKDLTGPSDFGEKSPIPTRWTDQPKVTAHPGDILITVKGSGVGKTNVLVDQPTAISRQLMAIRVTGADPGFVHVVLKRAAEHFQSAKTGIAIPGIARREVLGLKVVLPPPSPSRSGSWRRWMS